MPEATTVSTDVERVLELIAGRRVAVLTGAGISTDSGIPDYRGPSSPPRNPMTYQQFVGDVEFRQRYWARNHLGWRRMDAARPNPGHRALSRLERAGVVGGVITQNVDLLHTKAGSRRVIDLHGTYARVRCLDVILNRGRTRGDDLADLTVNAGCSEMLTALAETLTLLGGAGTEPTR